MSHSLHSDSRGQCGTVGCQPSAAELANFGPCHPLQVNFDDNNPFSEGFQERERRERLREQQERQRVQLLQEVRNLRQHCPHTHSITPLDPCALSNPSQVERHRAQHQQRLELEQHQQQPSQALLGSTAAPTLQGAPSGAPTTGGDGLSQLPFFSSELPQDFLQSPPPPPLPPSGASRPPSSAQLQGLQQGAHVGRVRFPTAAPSQDHQAGVQAQRLALEPLSSSSPISTSSSPAHLLQLYSDLLPEKRSSSRRRDGDDVSLSSHSDDITAPPTPALSDASCSTPTRGSAVDQSDASFSLSVCGLAPSSELEKQQPFKSLEVKVSSTRIAWKPINGNNRALIISSILVPQEERQEGRGACGGGLLKMEEDFSSSCSPLQGDAGKELLRHLLKDKPSPATTPSPRAQTPPTARFQLSNENIHSEEEDRLGSQGTMVSRVSFLSHRA